MLNPSLKFSTRKGCAKGQSPPAMHEEAPRPQGPSPSRTQRMRGLGWQKAGTVRGGGRGDEGQGELTPRKFPRRAEAATGTEALASGRGLGVAAPRPQDLPSPPSTFLPPLHWLPPTQRTSRATRVRSPPCVRPALTRSTEPRTTSDTLCRSSAAVPGLLSARVNFRVSAEAGSSGSCDILPPPPPPPPPPVPAPPAVRPGPAARCALGARPAPLRPRLPAPPPGRALPPPPPLAARPAAAPSVPCHAPRQPPRRPRPPALGAPPGLARDGSACGGGGSPMPPASVRGRSPGRLLGAGCPARRGAARGGAGRPAGGRRRGGRGGTAGSAGRRGHRAVHRAAPRQASARGRTSEDPRPGRRTAPRF
jgi:hypothetical protein